MAPRGGKKGAAAGEPAKEQPAVVGGLLMPLNALDGVHSLVLPAAAAPLAGGGSAEGVEALKSQLGGLTEALLRLIDAKSGGAALSKAAEAITHKGQEHMDAVQRMLDSSGAALASARQQHEAAMQDAKVAGERLLQSVGHGGGGGDGLKEALRGVQASMQALHSKFKI